MNLGIYWGYVELYWGYVGVDIILRLYWGHIGIMEMNMETTIRNGTTSQTSDLHGVARAVCRAAVVALLDRVFGGGWTTFWCVGGNGGMDPYSSPYIFCNNNPNIICNNNPYKP